MRLVTYDDGGPRLGLVREGRVADLAALADDETTRLAFSGARSFLAAGDTAIAAARRVMREAEDHGMVPSWPALEAVRLMAPVPDPRKILALAGNYREHLREGGGVAVPKERMVPNVFIKPVTTIVGPGEAIRLPGPLCTTVDYEGELGVVIGSTCHRVSVAAALDHVAGYLNVNDVSGRSLNIDVPREASARTAYFDWLNGKWFDTFAPMGPMLVLRDEVPDPQSLRLELRVNDQVRQSANTSEMIFGVAETVAWISQFVTLEPGDIIATGTPSGVGATTGTFLQPGDVVELEISGLGLLRNPVSAPNA